MRCRERLLHDGHCHHRSLTCVRRTSHGKNEFHAQVRHAARLASEHASFSRVSYHAIRHQPLCPRAPVGSRSEEQYPRIVDKRERGNETHSTGAYKSLAYPCVPCPILFCRHARVVSRQKHRKECWHIIRVPLTTKRSMAESSNRPSRSIPPPSLMSPQVARPMPRNHSDILDIALIPSD